jgi:hypothetical protein
MMQCWLAIEKEYLTNKMISFSHSPPLSPSLSPSLSLLLSLSFFLSLLLSHSPFLSLSLLSLSHIVRKIFFFYSQPAASTRSAAQLKDQIISERERERERERVSERERGEREGEIEGNYENGREKERWTVAKMGREKEECKVWAERQSLKEI